MLYKRNEPYRYQFPPPIPGHFIITNINGLPGQSKKGQIELIDISPRGCKFSSKLDLKNFQDIKLEVSFQINGHLLHLPGVIVWKKKYIHTFFYGYAIDENRDLEELILKEVKTYSKMIRSQSE
ncbi:PilZ domain-containing protein [Peribacillus tepidiphilus]|uniref:PilZ domain-containing protein n=1 Tax=Peribacillus tepidiphilus TaxID=2652445 RepID=UPI0035B52694